MSAIIPANNNLDELVFANRNKEYGAYALRKAYSKHVKYAFFYTFGGSLLLFLPALFSPSSLPLPAASMVHEGVILSEQMEFIDVTAIETSSRTEQVSEPSVSAAARDNTPLRIVPDLLVPGQTLQNGSISNTQHTGNTTLSTQTLTSGSGTGNTGAIGTIPTTDTENLIHTFVSKMPEFSYDGMSLNEYLAKNSLYPHLALQSGLQGVVVISAVVNTKGKLEDIRIIKSLGMGCDEEAVRVLAAMPEWQAGEQNGKKVAVRVTIPFRFALQD